MRRYEDGRAGGRLRLDRGGHERAGLRVEPAGRLVDQQHARGGCCLDRDRERPALTGGQVAGMPHPHGGEGRAGGIEAEEFREAIGGRRPRAPRVTVRAAALGRDRVADEEVIRGIRDQCDRAGCRRCAVDPHVVISAREGEGLQQRRLAGAVRAGQRDDLAGAEVEAGAVDREARAVAHGDPAGGQRGAASRMQDGRAPCAGIARASGIVLHTV